MMSENLVARSLCTMEDPTLLNLENRLKYQQLHKVDDFQVNAAGEVQNRVDGPSTFRDVSTGTTVPGCRGEEKDLDHNHFDFRQESLNDESHDSGSVMDSDNFSHNADEVENELPSSNWDGEPCHLEAEWSEQDEAVALWVKWRGMWQAGIRCVRADYPLPTLKARPTHDRKKYIVVFFPHTRNYSWADMLLVRPIHEFPEPIAHRTHSQGLEKVKDLTLPHRFIMQRLAVDMVNIGDQLHNEAEVEAARNVTVWKEFAKEASQCKDYSELGSMLVKLKSMILQQYIDPDWVQTSFESWAQRCQKAESAESVEMLKEELVNSVLWNEIEALWDAPVQPQLGSEWKTWKQEAMKWFSTSHPMATGRDMEQYDVDDSTTMNFPISRKRPKLEVRRAEMHVPQAECRISHETQPRINTAEIDSGFFNKMELGNGNTFISESKGKSIAEGSATSDSPGNMVGKWNGIVVETAKCMLGRPTVVGETAVDAGRGGKLFNPGNKSRQCLAFIEAKGRQCIRWANDGDDYCCVHLAVRDKSPKTEVTTPGDTPMCAGTTTLGTKCKHRSQSGSTFCKKHRLQHTQLLMDTEKPPDFVASTLKRSHSEMIYDAETARCQEKPMAVEGQNPVQVISGNAVEGENFDRRIILVENAEPSIQCHHDVELLHCVGSSHQNNSDPCPERAKFHTLYCEKHLPAFLKRARNGKSRIISKEIFMEFLKKCSSQKQKLHLHRACVLLHGFVKSVLSRRNPVSKETQLQWILSEASKDLLIGEYLMKLASCERDKLKRMWDFDVGIDKPASSDAMVSLLQPEPIQRSCSTQMNVKCKICSKEFSDDKLLGSHWMEIHKKEARWVFRSYACAICLNSFTKKKILETHGRETHQVQSLEQCLLLKCIPCGSHFVNSEQLWLHVVSVHSEDLKLSTVAQHKNMPVTQASLLPETNNNDTSENNFVMEGSSRRFVCKFCGLKFDILPDLGRHHQAVHMGLNSVGHISSKGGAHFNPYKVKSGRLSRPSFTKGLGAASYMIRNRGNISMKKHFQESSLASTGVERLQIQASEVSDLGRLVESQCSAVANSLFSEIQKAKPRPSNLDILSVARSTCCKIRLQASLEEQFGVLPERLYLRAAKLCSELNIQVEWHQEGFICPKGCKPVKDSHNSFTLTPLPHSYTELTPNNSDHPTEVEEWEMDEVHYIIESHHILSKLVKKSIVLCEDLSFGLESVPVNCVVDEDLVSSLRTVLDEGFNNKVSVCRMPWDSFTYVTERVLDASLGRDTESSQLGCACPHSICSPETCDHVYLFDNDYENAKDIYGQTMQGRFPYDNEGRIILEEGYLVYECNSSCSCDKTCPNRVLQNGVKVKLEVFKTENKGWAVRASEVISRGTFVCEFIGEVLNDEDANKRDTSYLYKIEGHIDDMNGLSEGGASRVIDASRYGNVSRFINHSCSPNLVCYQVLVESMDCNLAHIGLYASRDISVGEELAYDYHEKLLVSRGYPCYCSLPNCKGQIS